MGFEIDFEALRRRDIFFNQLEKEAKKIIYNILKMA